MRPRILAMSSSGFINGALGVAGPGRKTMDYAEAAQDCALRVVTELVRLRERPAVSSVKRLVDIIEIGFDLVAEIGVAGDGRH